MSGFGMRGFLSAFPQPSAEAAAKLASQGVMFWGHSVAVMKSIEAARAHDQKFSGLSKIMYLISAIDVSDLNDETPKEIVQARFKEIIAHSPLVYWDDSESILHPDSNSEPKFVEADMDLVKSMMVPKTIEYFTRDERGPRFGQAGWVFPAIRGELNYADVFHSGSKTIQKILKEGRSLVSNGYTVNFNQDFLESLNAARDQIRLEKGADGVLRKLEPNSRYRDPDVYKMALEGHHAGHNFSVEVRDPNGKLVGGVLGERNGNIVALDTVFYTYDERPDGSFRSNIDMPKIAVLAALQRLHESDIDVVDAGMVTPFTANLKGRYVSAKKFAQDIERLRTRNPISIDFSKAWNPNGEF
jgi:Leu/Phe-tRNA-protein transferase